MVKHGVPAAASHVEAASVACMKKKEEAEEERADQFGERIVICLLLPEVRGLW